MDIETRELLEQGLLRFSQEHFDPGRAQERSTAEDGFRVSAWKQMQDLGWFYLLGNDEGDALGSLEDLLPLYQMAGEYLWDLPLDVVFGGVAEIVVGIEDASRKATCLSGLLDASVPLAMAHREHPNGWSLAPPKCRASRVDGEWRLTGRKALVPGVSAASSLIVSATDSQSQTSFFLVEKNATGLSSKAYPCVDQSQAHDLSLDDVPARLLCQGQHILMRALHRASLLVAAESIGIMQGACRDTVTYLQQRKQFGRALIGFQNLQHRLVDMHVLAHESLALLNQTAAAFDFKTPDIQRQVLVLRAQVSRALRKITAEAVQLHGGMGVTQETRVARYYKRALMLDSLCGSADWALDQLAA